MSDATEEATPKRLREAQNEGITPVSSFATQSVAFLVAVLIAPAAVFALASRSSTELRAAIAHAGDAHVTLDVEPAALGGAVLALTTPLLAAAAVAAVVASVVQSGGVLAVARLRPRLDRLGFAGGRRTPASIAGIAGAVRAALFGAAVGWFAYSSLRDHAVDIAHTAGRLSEAAALAGVIARDVLERVAILGVLLAVVDVVVTRRDWRKRLRMSKREVEREQKETRGDPQLKAARARVHREMIASLDVASVERATIVVADHVHLACALRYVEGDGDEAPALVASGEGELAAQIVGAAHGHGVPVVEDGALATRLAQVETGSLIPEALYESVAEVLREARHDDVV